MTPGRSISFKQHVLQLPQPQDRAHLLALRHGQTALQRRAHQEAKGEGRGALPARLRIPDPGDQPRLDSVQRAARPEPRLRGHRHLLRHHLQTYSSPNRSVKERRDRHNRLRDLRVVHKGEDRARGGDDPSLQDATERVRVPQQRERLHLPRRGHQLRVKDRQGEQGALPLLRDKDRAKSSPSYLDFQMKIIAHIDENLITSMQAS